MTHLRKIFPDRRSALQTAPFGPFLGDRNVGRDLLMPRANGLREARANAGKFAQNLTGLPEIETGRELLDEVKNIAFGIAPRVPPSSALVADDQDLAVFPPIFKAVRRALPSIKPPWRRQAFQQGGAIHRRAQLLYFWVMRSHHFGSRSGFAGW